MTNRQPIDPASLVEGAKVTIEGTVESVAKGFIGIIFDDDECVFHINDILSRITSVTPPPTDWSKVKRARFQISSEHLPQVVTIKHVGKRRAFVEFENGEEFSPAIVHLTPLPDEPSAGEAREIHHTAVCARAQDEYSACDCGATVREQEKAAADAMDLAFNDPRAVSQQEPDMSVHLQNGTPDTRPAWQRAKVGDVVSVRAKVERIGYPEDHPEFRLNFGGCKIIAAGSDILEIVRQADEKC